MKKIHRQGSKLGSGNQIVWVSMSIFDDILQQIFNVNIKLAQHGQILYKSTKLHKKNYKHYATVAVWTQKPFTSLLTHPQGSRGCPKNQNFFLQIKQLSFCSKIAPKRHKLRKLSKLKKNVKKTLFFLDFFEYFSIWGQS